MKCKICGNTIGFTGGCCIECGYNYLSHKYEHIQVRMEDLKRFECGIYDLTDLEMIHEERIRDIFSFRFNKE